jgi:MFS family permease
MVVLALATAGLAAASSLPMVAVLRIGQGLVAASFAVVALAYVGEALPPRWRSTGIGAMSTAFLVAGIVGQVYSQAIAETLGWRWVFGLAAPALAIGAVAMAVVLQEPARSGPPVSWGGKYRELGALAVRRELALPYAANIPVLFSFVAMYAALGPLLHSQFGLGHGSVIYVRLPGCRHCYLLRWRAGSWDVTALSGSPSPVTCLPRSALSCRPSRSLHCGPWCCQA